MTFTCGRCAAQPPCPHWGKRIDARGGRTFFKIRGMWTRRAVGQGSVAHPTIEQTVAR